jgi:hypothetical protein
VLPSALLALGQMDLIAVCMEMSPVFKVHLLWTKPQREFLYQITTESAARKLRLLLLSILPDVPEQRLPVI